LDTHAIFLKAFFLSTDEAPAQLFLGESGKFVMNPMTNTFFPVWDEAPA